MSLPNAGESSKSISKATLADLKAIAAEHVDQFSREGRSAVKGQRRTQLATAKDPFQRPSPGLVKRLAAEAKNDAKRRHFADDAGPSDEQRRAILKQKARQYESMMHGDLSGLSDKQLEEMTVDFDRKRRDFSADEDDASDDTDGSASDEGDALDRIEYEDELGRTRLGTRKEALAAERARRKLESSDDPPQVESAFSEVQRSNVFYGDQNVFPVYEPDADAIRAKYKAAEEESRAHHYDSTKEVRAKGAGQYQFALDEDERAEQMAALKAQREETEAARKQAAGQRSGLSAAQEARKRKMEERRAAIDAKRNKLLGGQEAVNRLRAEKRAGEADRLLSEMRVDRCDFSGFKVYPSKGKIYVRGDSKSFRFLNSKNESLFLQRKNPRKIAWTQVYRRMHKKGITEEVAKKRSRKNIKTQRGIVGADLASILAKRTAKPEVRQAARQAAITKAKTEKRDKEAKKQAGKPTGAAMPKMSKQSMKGGAKGGKVAH
ncbi:ribosomal protein L24e-domain-containing protein [Kockovaella imperatae]|uniref:Ribosomal protein L24e-domain-containing protein n=1 Tax=Kockovaella imperatae TaxID=4999 RepID=A0A1Y1UKU9_9TREE|nr:ribosomal protein L24e-domain-containing protein [Kockovaella imperatae]ORX37755.1 ribosomal protein L24e-domain-containing protein [Kockovaella imperatae]